jgi:hypothetical protein
MDLRRSNKLRLTDADLVHLLYVGLQFRRYLLTFALLGLCLGGEVRGGIKVAGGRYHGEAGSGPGVGKRESLPATTQGPVTRRAPR